MTDAMGMDADASQVLRAARELAVERGEGKISPHVLLVALARTGGPSLRPVLARFGFDPGRAQDWLDTKVGRLRLRSAFDDNSPFSLRTQKILELAATEAREAGADAVRARDLLLGMLREPHAGAGMAGGSLIERGGTYEALRSALA